MSPVPSVMSGVPQVSVLPPLLFPALIASAITGSIFLKVQAYASDTQVYIHLKLDDTAVLMLP